MVLSRRRSWRACSVCSRQPPGALSSCKRSQPKQAVCPCTGTSASGRKRRPHLPLLAKQCRPLVMLLPPPNAPAW